MRYLAIAFAVLLVILGASYLGTNKVDNSEFKEGVGGGPGNTDTNNIQDNGPTIGERARLHTLLQEHSATAAIHLPNLYDGNETAETKNRLRDNTTQLNTFFAKFGDTTGFSALWNGRMQEYENYTLALKENDQVAAAEAKRQLAMHADEFGQFTNKIFTKTQAKDATDAMMEHGNLTLSIIDAHAKDDDSEKVTQITKASAQAAKFAETLLP